ncbi:phosphoglucosamine mutase [Balneolaceae bacterium ANBcel3]|nr:phosphoglucosamine mutase [Balneolaceae bacterium ANBcel3]
MSLMVSISGIRGIFGSDLNPQNLTLYASAFGTWVKGGTVVVGRDSRTTGELCERVVTSALQATGCQVVNLGITPTPTVAMGVLLHRASGGIVISASHNPAEWNALKLLNGKGEFLDGHEGKEVIDIARSHRVHFVDYKKVGKALCDETVLENHIDEILDLPYIDQKTIEKANLAVAVDAVNGAGSLAIPRLLQRLGVSKIHKIHCTPDGQFPHNPEPLPEHLEDICRFVCETKSDIGFVVDPDADRLALVDEYGHVMGEEYTQAIAFDFILRKKSGPVATNLSSSRVVDDVAAKYGQTCHRSAVGEINVVKKMQETGAVIGGEGNGGVISPDLHYGRDALVGIAMILQFMAEEKKTASALKKDLPEYHIVKTKIQLDEVNPDFVLSHIQNSYADQKMNTEDGLKIDFPHGWIHLRKSNTEPIVRIYAEAASKEEATKLISDVQNAMNTL